MLVMDGDEGPKVLLTNTVYPLKPLARDPKLTRCLRAKTSPAMIVRAVAAWPLAAEQLWSLPVSPVDSGFLPGG